MSRFYNQQPLAAGISNWALRCELVQQRARYDDGAIPLAIFNVIRELEVDISWLEHRREVRS
jgi:hypothetical protein